MTRTAWIIVGVVAVALVFVLARCTAPSTRDAVALDRMEAAAVGANVALNTERASIANQLAAERAFANAQQQDEDRIDEAARTRRSPLDALFNQLR